jgi:hypothetical protein
VQNDPGGGRFCAFAECDRSAVEGELCGGHAKQRRRGLQLRPLRSRYGSKRERVEAAIAELYAGSDEDDPTIRHRLWMRLAVAMRAWAFAEKPTDPRRRLQVNVVR